MFKIGEFSKLMQVTVRMLRYYDQVGLLPPAEVDPWTGYRLYSVDQIPVLNKIIYLRDSGFSVAEIAAALSGTETVSITDLLDRKRADIEMNMIAETEKLRKIDLAKKDLIRGTGVMHDQVTIKEVPGYPVLSLRQTVPDYYAEGQLWAEMSAFAQLCHCPVCGDTFTIYHDPDYREADIDMELCAPVRTMGENRDGFSFRHTEPVPVMACTMVYGTFDLIAEGYLAFASWLQRNSSYQMSGPSRQMVHRGPWNEENPDNYLTELQIPLTLI